MFELVFLGTSASAPSVRRGLSALVVKYGEHRFLIDCGEGTQRQILRSGVGFKRLNRIFLTHGHLDHILGLAGLISTYMRWEVIDEIEIYGTKHTLDRVEELIFNVVLRGTTPPMPIKLLDIQPGLIFESGRLTVHAFPVNHRGSSSLGYRFEEASRRPFLPEKAEALAIPPGPWRKDLVAGLPISLPDGRVIHPDQVLGEEMPGLKLVVVGDTGRPEELIDEIQGADGLVIEATYIQEEAALAKEFGHTTAADVALLARDAGVKQLFLTHISRRYSEKQVLDEAQAIFEGVKVARDFDSYFIKREE